MAEARDFETWLVSRLESLDLDGEVFAGYVTGILEEDEKNAPSQCESVVELLSASTDEDMRDFRGELERKWLEEILKRQAAESAERARGEAELEAKRAREREELKEAERAREEKKAADQNRSTKERMERDRILNNYGFIEDELDEDGNPMDKVEGPSADDVMGSAMGKNDNKAQVLAIAQAQRAQAKAAHAAKVIKDKQDLERDRKRKEEAKKRSQKQERKPRG